MKLNTLETLGGQSFVLLPTHIYENLKPQITRALKSYQSSDPIVVDLKKLAAPVAAKANADYVPFKLDDYVRNPVAKARIEAGLTQVQLAKRMKVTQPYIAKLEAQGRVSKEKLAQVRAALTT
jgi:ribosome-binding protein aMBF1 (putative translation factor)